MPPLPPLRTENFAETTLAENVSDSDTSFDVASAAVFALAGGQAIVRIDDELLLVKSAASNTLTVERGHEGTTPASHTSGATVGAVVTKEMLRRFTAERQAAPENLIINGGFDFFQRQTSSSWSAPADMLDPSSSYDPYRGFDRWRFHLTESAASQFQTIGDHVSGKGLAMSGDPSTPSQLSISQIVPAYLSQPAFPGRRIVLDFWARDAADTDAEIYAGIYHTAGFTRDRVVEAWGPADAGGDWAELEGVWENATNDGNYVRLNGFGVSGRSGPFVLTTAWQQFSVWGVTTNLSYPDVKNLMAAIWTDVLSTSAQILITGVALRIAEGSYYPFQQRHPADELRLCRHFFRRGLVDSLPPGEGLAASSGSATHSVAYEAPMFVGAVGEQQEYRNGVTFLDAASNAGSATLHTVGSGDIQGSSSMSTPTLDSNGWTASIAWSAVSDVTGYYFTFAHDTEIRYTPA